MKRVMRQCHATPEKCDSDLCFTKTDKNMIMFLLYEFLNFVLVVSSIPVRTC